MWGEVKREVDESTGEAVTGNVVMGGIESSPTRQDGGTSRSSPTRQGGASPTCQVRLEILALPLRVGWNEDG
jgi:hypothetical protein